MMDYYVEKNGVLDERSNLAYGLTIDEDFIPVMQIKILEGRNFSSNISTDSNEVIVNEAFIKDMGGLRVWVNEFQGVKIQRVKYIFQIL